MVEKKLFFFFVYFSAVASLLAAVCILFPKKFLFPNSYRSSLQVFGSWVCIFFSLLTLFLTYNDRLIWKMSRVYVGNLSPRVTERDLEDEFRTFGVIRR